jgi:hypothetical protein
MMRDPSSLVGLLLAVLGLTLNCMGQEKIEALDWRNWSRGAQSFEASLQGVEDGRLILKSRDGRVATIAAVEFSAGNIAYVKDRLAQMLAASLEKGAPVSTRSTGSGWEAFIRLPEHLGKVKPSPEDQIGRFPRFVSAFQSQHFAFWSEQTLPPAVMANVALRFELIRELIRLSPWGGVLGDKDIKPILVHLYSDTGTYEVDAGTQSTSCHYDQEKGILRATLEGCGLLKFGDEWINQPWPHAGQSLQHELSIALFSNAIGLVPDWMLGALARRIQVVPMVGDRAWPLEGDWHSPQMERAARCDLKVLAGLLSPPPKPESEPPKITETLAPDGVTIHVTVEKPTSSHVMLDYKGMEMQQLAEAILGWHFVEKHPQKVVSLVAAALDARQKHDSYRAAVARYKEEFAAFVRQPGVEHIGGREYRFPADLVPPKEPGPPPFPNDIDDLKFLHIDKLLGGESAELVAKEALSQAEALISSRK